jgi:Predicted S-adenosylmethionine-dependent methyltransferase involved in cell envelope biogenesis
MSATIKLENKHFPVLLKELISIISPLYGGTFLDCTFGQGGYSKKILEKKNNKIIAVDRDKDVYLYAKKFEKKYNDRFHYENIKFSEINTINVNFKGP